MLRRALLALPLALLLALPARGQTPGPVRIITDLYARYQASTDAPVVPERAGESFFTPETDRLYAQGSADRGGDAPILDWDVFVNGQDFQISDLKITAAPAANGGQTVTATFRNIGEPAVVIYDFVPSPEGWRVADLHYPASDFYPDGFSLKAHLTAALSEE